MTDRVDQLWEAAVTGDAPAAADAVRGALDDGWAPEAVLLDLIARVQRRVGQEWADARIDVAQEHTATAINDRAVTALMLRAAPLPHRGRVTVACVDGEWHALPARLLAEVLVLRGFTVDYLGAQVPAAHLVAHVHRTGPEAVALSGSLAPRIPVAHSTIAACTATGTPVIVGGAAFGPDGRYAALLGAQAWAPDARSAADLLEAGPLPRPGLPSAPLSHLEDQEYTMVSLRRADLVRGVYRGLCGDGADPVPDGLRERTAEDLAHLVDYLGAALYTDDDTLFADYLGWTADVRAGRGAPVARDLPRTVELLAAELREFPRACRVLAAGRAVLARRTPLEAS